MILWCISWMHSYTVLHGIFSVRCSSRGWVRRRCCRHKEGDEDEASLMKFLIIPPPLAQGVASECHLGQRSLWSHIYEIHLSPSFLSLFLFFLLHAGSFSRSALIGGAVKVYGVSASSRWGLACISHWFSPSDASTIWRDRACCSSYQISASLTKATVLNPLSAPQIT